MPIRAFAFSSFVALSTAISLALTAAAVAAPVKERETLWDLKIGTPVADMPPWIAFKGYACGSDGGPPLAKLSGWSDFAKCTPGANGLHEVYFEYDDEDEYIARAHEDIRIGRDIGTTDKSFPIVASALFDNEGILKGLRLVTDPRADAEPDNEYAGLRGRSEHHLLGPYLAGQFKINRETDCHTLPLGPEETAVAGGYVKLDCVHADDANGLRYLISTRFFRKPGQAGRDPNTGALTKGQFESITRAEILALDVPYKTDLEAAPKG